MSASQLLLTIRLASVHSSAVKNTGPESVRGHHSLWSVSCRSAALLPGMPAWVLSEIRILSVFLWSSQHPLLPIPAFTESCGIYQDFAIRSLMTHTVIPAPGLLF